MKLSKKKEKELMPVYEAYWDYYLKGDAKAMQHLLDESYTQVGSAESEVFSTKKDAVQFLFDTIDQVAGKLEMRNRHTKIELQDNVVLIHELCDLYALTNKEWVFYSKFRASTLMQEKKEGWKITHQHSSFPDTKTEEGQNVAIDKIAEENSQLREAIKRRTFELEEKNRELEVESALERIRAQAVAMQQSSDLLDIVVTMRNEFTKLGHEAHYFWHMMWLPETYEKAMTSGDGSKIGFVMKLPRHMHGDIPLLAKWEKSKKPTIVYAMTTKEAIEYVDKMVLLGDFQNIDPQAPSHDDLKHIGGLTFFMARTTHGEIGYSLPGVVKNPPKEDIDILVKFAGAFDLAHQRFLDLQKAEAQARETQIELALEKVRTASMTMKKGEELAKLISVVFTQLKVLGIDSEGCGLNLYDN
ncbi:MAG: nuclear transport factor 2 family protein, partial [Maribacter sp.]|nr:nuclear transport factor 2 family protein [Maribacter sp.]